MKNLLVSVKDFREIVEGSYDPDFSATSLFHTARLQYPTLSDALLKCADWFGFEDEREEIEEVIQYDIRYSFMLAMQAVVTRFLSDQGITRDNVNHAQLREGGIIERDGVYYVSVDASVVYRFLMKDISIRVQFEIPAADWAIDENLGTAIQALQDNVREAYAKNKVRLDAAIQAQRDFRSLAGTFVQKFREEANVAYLDHLRSSSVSGCPYPLSLKQLLESAHKWLHEDGELQPSSAYSLAIGHAIGVAMQKVMFRLLNEHYGVHQDNIRSDLATGNVYYLPTDSVHSSESVFAIVTASVDYTLGPDTQRIDTRVELSLDAWNEDWAIQNAIESIVKTVDRVVSRHERVMVQSQPE